MSETTLTVNVAVNAEPLVSVMYALGVAVQHAVACFRAEMAGSAAPVPVEPAAAPAPIEPAPVAVPETPAKRKPGRPRKVQPPASVDALRESARAVTVDVPELVTAGVNGASGTDYPGTRGHELI